MDAKAIRRSAEREAIEPLRDASLPARILHSRLGNVLLSAHVLFQVREILLRPPINWHNPYNYTLVADPERYDGWSACYHPSLSDVLYNLAHAPTWLAIATLEWIAKPVWDNLWVVVAQQTETALFVFVGALQWLVVGYLAETSWAARNRARPKHDALPSILPESLPDDRDRRAPEGTSQTTYFDTNST